ncbi:hypothetical protein AAHB58_01025 [Enterobacter hormaechei]|jgi:hypothetical protein
MQINVNMLDVSIDSEWREIKGASLPRRFDGAPVDLYVMNSACS